MPDIRMITNALSLDDKKLYCCYRTKLRNAYLQAIADILANKGGIGAHNEQDDAFLDFIDIKIALLFDRAGVFDTNLGKIDKTIGNEVILKTEASIHKLQDKVLPKNTW